jgi:osmotically-inducible protein OsmY
MKAFVGTLACVGALAMVSVAVPAAYAGQATTTTTTEKKIDKKIDRSDKAINERIEKRLKADRSLRRHQVDVSVQDRVAVLTGTVATRAQRTRAASIARAEGAVKVENRIDVGASADTTTTGTSGTLARKSRTAIDKSREGAEGAWDKTKEGAVTADIKTRFMGDEALRASDIHVSTEGHVVTLTGIVPTEAARVKAVETARKVNGVDKVVDNLRVR